MIRHLRHAVVAYFALGQGVALLRRAGWDEQGNRRRRIARGA